VQLEDEMFSATSDSPEEDDDEEDLYTPTLSPGYATSSCNPSRDDDTLGDDFDDFPYEVLTADQVVAHMVDCIKEVNTVVQVPAADAVLRTVHGVTVVSFCLLWFYHIFDCDGMKARDNRDRIW